MTKHALVVQGDLFERAIERASLVRAALMLLEEEGVVLDFQSLAAALLTRVGNRYGLRLDKPKEVQQAKAFAILIINLALDRATGGSPEKSASALKKNAPIKIYMIGEHLLDEDRPRIATVLKKNVITITDEEKKRRWLEVVPEGLRNRLNHWSQVGLVMLDGWPPSTMEAVQECRDVIDHAAFDVRVASRVDWQAVMNVGQAAVFPLMYFRRQKMGVDAPNGGIWEAFLRSLYINAMIGEAWYAPQEIRMKGTLADARADSIRRRVFVDPKTLRLFVERIVIDPETLAEKYTETTARIAQTMMAKHGGEAVFKRALSEDDVLLVSKRAEELLRGLAQDAFNFYLSVDDVMQIDVGTLDRFWSVRVLLTSKADIEMRFAEVTMKGKKPWERLPFIKTPVDLSVIVAGFAAWTDGARSDFLDEPSRWMKVLRSPVAGKSELQAEALNKILTVMVATGSGQRFLDAVRWGEVDKNLLHLSVLTHTIDSQTAPWFGQMIARKVLAGVSREVAAELLGNLKPDQGFEAALMVLSSHWSESDWTDVFKPGNWIGYFGKVEAGWNAMSPEMRPNLCAFTDGITLGHFVRDRCSRDEAREFVRQINRWADSKDKSRTAVRCWLGHGLPGLKEALAHRWPGTDWDSIFTVKTHG